MNAPPHVEPGFIQRIIRFSAENKYLVIAIYAIVIVLAVGVIRRTPLDAIPDLSDTQVIIYFALGPEPRHPRGPGHVSDRDGASRSAEGEDDPGLLGLRLLVRLRHLRGRHRHLLGALARPRVPVEDPVAPPRRGEDRARARRDERRLDLPVRARRREREERDRRDPLVSGLVPEVRGAIGAGRRGGRERGRLPEAVPGDAGPEHARGVRPAARVRRGGDPQEQQRDRRAPHRVLGARIHGPGPRLPQVGRGHRKDRRQDEREGDAADGRGHRARVARPRDSKGHLRSRRQGGRRGRHRRDAQRRERARRHRAGEDAAEGDRALAPLGREDRHDVRPVGPDQALPSTRSGAS